MKHTLFSFLLLMAVVSLKAQQNPASAKDIMREACQQAAKENNPALWLYSNEILSNPLLYLSYFFKTNRLKYYDLLMKVSIEGDFETWIDFFLDGINKMSEISIQSINQIQELKEQDTRKVVESQMANHSRALSVLDYLYKYPFVTSNDLIDHLKLTKPTVGKILNEFVDLGILRFDSTKKRYRQYRYQNYIDILHQGTDLDF